MSVAFVALLCLALIVSGTAQGSSSSSSSAATFRGVPLIRHESGVKTHIRLRNGVLLARWCGAGTTGDATAMIAMQEATQFADMFQVRPLELLCNSFDALPSAMPNSRRLFQTLPSAMLTRDEANDNCCVHAELSLSEANGAVCSPFLKRAVLAAHGGNETEAALFLDAALGEELQRQASVVVRNSVDASANVERWRSRQRFVAASTAAVRTELDRLAGIAWQLRSAAFGFEVVTDGRRGEYTARFSSSLLETARTHAARLRMRIEHHSELSHSLHFSVLVDSKALAAQAVFEVALLARFPRHLVKLVDEQAVVTAWWQAEDAASSAAAPRISNQRVLRPRDVVFHPERARSCDAAWILFDVDPSGAEPRGPLFIAVLLRGVVVPRLPVEAYAPDLNRLVALPPAMLAVRAKQAGAEQAHWSVPAALRDWDEAKFVRSENRVSVYQPGPDRAVPFVVLAFAALPISVLLIRTVAAVAKD